MFSGDLNLVRTGEYAVAQGCRLQSNAHPSARRMRSALAGLGASRLGKLRLVWRSDRHRSAASPPPKHGPLWPCAVSYQASSFSTEPLRRRCISCGWDMG